MKTVKKMYPHFETATMLPIKFLFIIAMLVIVSFSANSQIYVDSSATGNNNGNSWVDAYIDLQDALGAAQPGDQIWVAQGTYYPTTNLTDRDATFHLISGVELYGGFNGTETNFSQRDWEINETILSGDINQTDSLDDNSYTVVTGSGTDSTAVIDGFTITMGNADAVKGPGGNNLNPNHSGGAMYNNGGSPTVMNCTFSGNYANRGGGMFNIYSSSPLLTNCIFSGNESSFGGGMFNFSSSPTLTNSTFSGNEADYGFGGGMYNSGSSPTVTNTTFSGNEAVSRGGGMYNQSNSSPTVTNSTFSGNTASFGGGMNNHSNSSPTVTNSTFSGNEANSHGGGMYNVGSSPTVGNSIFSDNTAGYSGGGIFNSSSNPTVTNTTFSGNTASSGGGGMYNVNSSPTVTNNTFSGNDAVDGGGMYNVNSSPTVTNNTFSENTADWGFGGGMYNKGSTPSVMNTTFSGNEAESSGGGMYNDNSSLTITKCTFTGNSAVINGGGMCNFESSPTVTNCTFLGNEANFGGGMFNNFSSPTILNSTFSGNSAGVTGDGGGIYNNSFSSASVTNSIIWGNGSNNFSNDGSSNSVINYTLIQESSCPPGATCNSVIFNEDPLFVDTASNNFQLTSLSPAINAGNPDTTGLNLPETDLAGNPRILNDTIDMGAYEYGEVSFELSGHVATSFGVNVNNVAMVMTGDESQIEFTTPQGLYDFLVEGGNTVTVTPEKDENWLDGITTLDLVFTQLHILNLNPFDNPYKIIAADVNNSGGVSTFDLVLLQSLILGQIDEIPGNVSWRFVPEDYTFIDPNNPLAENWPEQEVYPNVSTDLPDEDWVAIKTGDVTGEAGASGTRRLEDNYLFHALQRPINENLIEMEVRIAQNMYISGYQLEFQYDPSVMTYRGMDFKNSKLKGLNTDNFHHDGDQGVIRMVWYKADAQQLSTAQEVIRFQFTPHSERLRMEDHIRIGSPGTLWNSHVIDAETDHMIPRLQWIEEELGNQYALHQSEPNPFSGETVIPFELPRAMKVNLEIIDANGSLLQTYDIDGHKGMNRYRINLRGHQSGMLYYRLKAEEWSGVKKMILVD